MTADGTNTPDAAGAPGAPALEDVYGRRFTNHDDERKDIIWSENHS